MWLLAPLKNRGTKSCKFTYLVTECKNQNSYLGESNLSMEMLVGPGFSATCMSLRDH